MISSLPLLFALQTPPAPAPSAPAPEGTAAGVLRQEKYRFCHDPEYPLTRWEHQWCPLVGEDKECPAYATACKGPPVETQAGPVAKKKPGKTAKRKRAARGSGSGDKGTTGKDPSSGNPSEPPDSDRQKVSVPSGMSFLAKVIFFALLAVGLFAVARAIFANLLRDDDDKEPSEDTSAAKPAKVPEPVRLGPVETDVARLLARAKAAAARGQYEEALQDTYAALLRRLEGSGLVDVHPSRTNGDYVKDLRERPELKSSVREIFRDVERVHFGAEAASPGLFQSVFDRVVAIAGQALGILALCLGLGAAISCAPETGPSATESVGTEDASPSGTAAVLELLNGHGIKTRYRLKSLEELGDEDRTLVLLGALELDDADWNHLFEWLDRTNSTLVIAGLRPLPARIHTDLAQMVEKGTDLFVAEAYQDALGELSLAVPSQFYLAPRADAEPVLLRVDPATYFEGGAISYAMFQRVNLGRVIVFADDSLFTNIALVPADNAAFLLNFFTHFGSDVEFCDASVGMGAETPLEAVQNAKLTPVILQLLALLALLYLSKGIAFGRLRDPPALSRRAFSDHARALGVHYERARASKHVLGHYASWAIERLRERTQRGARRGLSALAEAIAARVRIPESDVMRVLVEAQSAHDESAPPSFRPSVRGALLRKPEAEEPEHSRDLALMRELDRFLSVTRGGEPSPKQKPMGPT